MTQKLPRPRCVSLMLSPKLSLLQFCVVFEQLLTAEEYSAVNCALRLQPAVVDIYREDLEDGVLVHVRLKSNTSDAQAAEAQHAAVTLLNPRLRPCIAELRVATKRSPKRSVSLAFVEVTCPFRVMPTLLLGAQLERELAPLGDKVSQMPNVPRAKEGYIVVAIQPFREPEDVGRYLADALERIGLQLDMWHRTEISISEYFAGLATPQQLN